MGAVCVVELGPGGLVVGLDGGIVLGEREANADEGVHVAVGEVVDELANRPTAVAIGRVELAGFETGDSVAQVAGKLRQRGDCVLPLVDGDGGGWLEAADGVSGVGVGHEGLCVGMSLC